MVGLVNWSGEARATPATQSQMLHNISPESALQKCICVAFYSKLVPKVGSRPITFNVFCIDSPARSPADESRLRERQMRRCIFTLFTMLGLGGQRPEHRSTNTNRLTSRYVTASIGTSEFAFLDCPPQLTDQVSTAIPWCFSSGLNLAKEHMGYPEVSVFLL